ncbi:MAG: hypothetical protein AB7R55_10190 [Gemmatimonadales bacterium]
MIRRVGFSLAIGLAACRGEPPARGGDAAIAALIDSAVPQVERAVGMTFSKPPRYAVRSKEQVRRFLLEKLESEFPDERVRGIETTYQLLGLLPDTIDTKQLLLGLYAEQVAGYYDPDSTTLYIVEGAEGDQLRLVLAHELVHALQHERLPLDELLGASGNADAQVAFQAVMEGHATLAMLGVILPDPSMLLDAQFWELYRDQIRTAQTTMPIFQAAPLVLREGLVFPYLAGAEFMRSWETMGGEGPFPSRDELPTSTEQILHPDRYRAHDEPLPVRFEEPADGVLHEDTMGELEIQVWRTVLRGGGEVLTDLAIGWGGDRYRLYDSPVGPALVLYIAWDDSSSARRFADGPAARFAEEGRPGYRTTVARLTLDGHPVVRVVRAPEAWSRWADLPRVRVAPAAEGEARP